MTHYKVHPDLCENLADGQHAFCGIHFATLGETFHLLGAIKDNGPAWLRPVVDCPKCVRMYDAVINDYLGRREP